jgi:hypothetical protein
MLLILSQTEEEFACPSKYNVCLHQLYTCTIAHAVGMGCGNGAFATLAHKIPRATLLSFSPPCAGIEKMHPERNYNCANVQNGTPQLPMYTRIASSARRVCTKHAYSSNENCFKGWATAPALGRGSATATGLLARHWNDGAVLAWSEDASICTEVIVILAIRWRRWQWCRRWRGWRWAR